MLEFAFSPQKISLKGEPAGSFDLYSSKVVCVGRNYVAHAKELNNPIPKTPIIFIKSSNALVNFEKELTIPTGLGECQHELEIALLVKSRLSQASREQCVAAIGGVGIGLDLTLRELQSELKSKGQPWEKAKSFDGACPISGFVDLPANTLKDIEFSLKKNGQVAQLGRCSDMIFDCASLLESISKSFTLFPGDIVLTGTPEGVAKLSSGDYLEVLLNNQKIASARIKS